MAACDLRLHLVSKQHALVLGTSPKTYEQIGSSEPTT